MPDKPLQLVGGQPSEVEANALSAGAGDAGKIVALDASGRLSSTQMPVGVAADTTVAPASEDLTAGDEVNLWNDGGTLKVRKADATTSGKPSYGFVSANVTAPANATVMHEGTNSDKSGLTVGALQFLSTTPGAVTETAPTGSGNIVQQIGVAKSATSCTSARSEPITRA